MPIIRRAPEIRRKMQGLAYAIGGFVLLIGAYNGATATTPAPIWLTVANVVFGLANIAIARFTERVTIQIEVAFEAITGLLIFGTAYATYMTGPRHWPLASAWAFAGSLYIAVAILHWVKKTRVSKPV